MEVHTIQADNKLMIFGIVSKKRKDFNGDNIACVRIFDTRNYTQIPMGIIRADNSAYTLKGAYEGECTVMNIKSARQGWDEFVKGANENNSDIETQESIYKTMNGSSILTDSEIHEAMDDICRKQIWRMNNPNSNEVEPTTGKGELGIVPKGTKFVTMEDEAPEIAEMLEKQFPLKNAIKTITDDYDDTRSDNEKEKMAQHIYDITGCMTEHYKG